MEVEERIEANNIFKNDSHYKLQENPVQERKCDYSVNNIYIVIIPSVLIIGVQLLQPTHRRSWGNSSVLRIDTNTINPDNIKRT